MRDWLVGGGIVEAAALGVGAAGRPRHGVLMVENLRRGGARDWTPPGGVVDAGEDLRAGLTREVREETGLEVLEWHGPLYEVRAEAPGLGWRLRVEVHRAVTVRGELTVGDDPDGIVVGASFVDPASCGELLAGAHPWVREPLVDWLAGTSTAGATYRYLVEGDDPGRLEVRRVEPQ